MSYHLCFTLPFILFMVPILSSQALEHTISHTVTINPASNVGNIPVNGTPQTEPTFRRPDAQTALQSNDNWRGFLISASEELSKGILSLSEHIPVPYPTASASDVKTAVKTAPRVRPDLFPRTWIRRLLRVRRSHHRLKKARRPFNYNKAKETYLVHGTSDSRNTPSGLLDRDVSNMFREMLTRCLPASDSSAELGYYRIKQSNTFSLECGANKTRPLYTFDKWRCDTKYFFKEGYHVPSMCVDKKLPGLVTLTRHATLVGLRKSGCGHHANLDVLTHAWRDALQADNSQAFKVDNFQFNFRDFPKGGLCNGSFAVVNGTENAFKVSVKVVFQVWHEPTTYLLKDTTRQQVVTKLDTKILELLSLLEIRHIVDHFIIDKSDIKFKASLCGDIGSAVENSGRFFHKDIPPCRICDRGLFLDMKTKHCRRCPRGTYSERGATECTQCPIAENKGGVSADSMHDCYALPLCKRCYWEAIEEGAIVVIIYHLICLGVVVWNLRYALINVAAPASASSKDRRLSTM